MTKSVWRWMVLVGSLGIACTLLLLAGPAFAADAPATAKILDPSTLKWAYLAAGGTTAVTSVAAAFAVARVGSAAVGALAEKPELFGRVLVLVGLAEGIAIYGLITSILILNQLS